jgi:tetratricopeptide (TPR) repeat protein
VKRTYRYENFPPFLLILKTQQKMKKLLVAFTAILIAVTIGHPVHAQIISPSQLIFMGAVKGIGELQKLTAKKQEEKQERKQLIEQLDSELEIAHQKSLNKSLTQQDIEQIEADYYKLLLFKSKKIDKNKYTQKIAILSKSLLEIEQATEKQLALTEKVAQERLVAAENKTIEDNQNKYSILSTEIYNKHNTSEKQIYYIKSLQTLATDPKNKLSFPDTMYAIRGEAYYNSNQYKSAIIDLEEYNKLSNNTNTYYNNLLLLAYLRIQEVTKAEDICNKIIQQNPNNTEIQYSKYLILKEQDKLDEAVEQIEKIANNNPTNTKYNLNAAELNYQMKSYTEAKKYYLRLVGQKQATKENYEDLGFCYLQTGEKSQAIEAFNKSNEFGNRAVVTILNDLKNDVAYVNGNNIPMYNDSNKKAKIIAYLNSGMKITAIQTNAQFTSITCSNIGAFDGAGGYIESKNIALCDECITIPQISEEDYTLPKGSPLASIPEYAKPKPMIIHHESYSSPGIYIGKSTQHISRSTQYRRGRRGGCYYIGSTGRKQYVDRSLCD